MTHTSSGAERRAPLPRLLVFTDRSQLRLGRGLVRTITECVDAGLTHVVLREHDLAPDHREALVGALAGVPNLTVISSRIADPAADGLHQPSTSACDARHPGRHLGRLMGRSCHTTEEVRRAAGDGVDYVTLSPFAATRSKPGYGPALTARAYAGHEVPVFALGGITVENASTALAAGAHGVAVMGAVMRSADPARTVAQLLEASR